MTLRNLVRQVLAGVRAINDQLEEQSRLLDFLLGESARQRRLLAELLDGCWSSCSTRCREPGPPPSVTIHVGPVSEIRNT